MGNSIDVSAYQAAESLLFHNRSKLARGLKVKPNWLDGGARFWYEVDGPDGAETVLVDPATGTREPGHRPEPGPELGFGSVLSPAKRHAVYRDGHDIWVHSLDDGTKKPLTTDGEPDYEYGTAPAAMTPATLLRRFGFAEMPPAVVWSPDSTRVLTHRTDQRGMRETALVDAMPPEGGAPKLRTQRYAYPGDEKYPHAELVVLDVRTGEMVRADAEPIGMPVFSPVNSKQAWWAEDGSAVYYLRGTRDMRTLRLHRLDPATGEVTTLIEETGPTRVEPTQAMAGKPIVKVIDDGAEVLWYSQRDGWGHLYRYDAKSGELLNQVTSGEWPVQQILHVDETARVVYFVAAGLIEEDPYRRTVCRAGLDGTGFAKITDDEFDHVVSVPDNGSYFVDSMSTTDTPPVTTVRDWDGRVLVELERADISALLGTGWTPPERFRVKAADGVTDVYGLLYLPHDFDPEKWYPVLNRPYPSVQMNTISPAFDQGWFGCDAETSAALGFVVVLVEGRGTAGRSKAFHDMSYGHLADAGGLADHVAAIKQLAETRPWMDLDRVGLYGMSGGGFATVRGLCEFGDFYHVGVAICGNHDNRYYHLGWAEAYDGPDPAAWARSSNVDIADRLRGKLMLIHGGMDDNVHPDHTMRLVDALIAADKDFDLLIIPGAEHLFFGYQHYLERRKWDFLVRNLMELEPPAGFRLTPAELDLELIAEMFGS